MKIAFIWPGFRLHNGKRFKDGLWEALEILKQKHEIRGFEPEETQMIIGFNPDRILYWGALIEQTKPSVAALPYKKAICFAGGPINGELATGFDLYFTESEVNEREFGALGKPWMRAFGVNEKLYKPLPLEKKYDAIFFGTHAQWKRNDLFARAIGRRGISIGLFQDHEKDCYQIPQEQGCEVHNEIPREELVQFINHSRTALNTANVWGGGQRMTLEAMACNVPPIVMTDSPKNQEYVIESGIGLIVKPDISEIQEAVEKLKGTQGGRDYILSKYTAQHYADALEKGLTNL
jgi:glycosyltransferase involved in cell wall biosynthesis